MRKPRKYDHANIALCYIRQSFTRDESDVNSPERQRANIEEALKRKGWTPEWYEDVGGHKSGRKEDNRPEWLKLKSRLGAPDVVALVANDLARLHRKGWRVGDLIETLEQLDVALVLAAPNREVDTSTPVGKMFVQFSAMIDEYYAEDISQRAKDSVQYRKKRGISIGRPPFGTIRGEKGYLEPSPKGAWLLPDGTFVDGSIDASPVAGAIWRSYYDCAHLILMLYAKGNRGLEMIAYQLNDEGWPFCDRHGQVRRIERDDVRRVVANWSEYGGLVYDRKAKDRPAYEHLNVETITFNERAVFDHELLRRVATVRQQRTRRPLDAFVKRGAFPYALSGLVYCAQCDRVAEQEGSARTRLTGHTDTECMRRYRHKAGVACGCRNRSVQCDTIEADFGRLLRLMAIDETAVEHMTRLAAQKDVAEGLASQTTDFEQQKTEAIALCRRRIDAAVKLFGDGFIEYDEFRAKVDENEREIAEWEARITEQERITLELSRCMEMIGQIADIWESGDAEDRQSVAQNLFNEIVYDLDTQRIESFRLKPWAERFVTLRMPLYPE